MNFNDEAPFVHIGRNRFGYAEYPKWDVGIFITGLMGRSQGDSRLWK